MIEWDAKVWATVASAFFAGIAVALSLLSLYFSMRKPISDWQRQQRSRLRNCLHETRIELKRLQVKRPEFRDADIQKSIMWLETFNDTLLSIKESIIAPRPRQIDQIMQLVDEIIREGYSQSTATELNKQIHQLINVINNIDNGSLIARVRYTRRWIVKRDDEGWRAKPITKLVRE